MTTLQKFKFLAVQCTIAESPSRSPSTSPALQLRRRRRKTLKKLLKETLLKETAGGSRLIRRSSRTPDREEKAEEKKPVDGTLGGRTLKDLFVSSPTYTCSTESEVREPAGERPIGGFETAASRGGSAGTGTMRTIVALRYRLLRRPWRPVLMAIPE